jgi:hypothetical protein
MINRTQDLVSELARRGESGDEDAKNFYVKFELMNNFLKTNYYPYIRDNCPYYTDHGEKHINGVIWSASQLIKKEPVAGSPASVFPSISTFDVYILLTAIIWHDAGMLAARKGHETAVKKLLDQFLNIVFENVAEQRYVEQIIAAHTGANLSLAKMRFEDHYLKHLVHPRAMAAILRFADEVSEDASRISIPILKQGQVPIGQRIYWYYAKSVQASRPEPERERIVLTVELDSEEAIMEFESPFNKEKKITLVEYLLHRIDKINRERAYCAPHFLKFASVQSIETRFGLLKGTNRVDGYEEIVEFGGEYPEIQVYEAFFRDHPRWTPQAIKSIT